MNAHTTITPMKAAQLVEAAGIADGKRIIADFAAGGFVKSYALSIETLDMRGDSTVVLGPKIPKAMWKRIVQAGRTTDVWTSGTVHLAGAAIITGITFKPDSIDWLIAHHVGAPPSVAGSRKPAPARAVAPEPTSEDVGGVPVEVAKDHHASPPAIPPGALFASMEQTMRALNKSRGTIYNLIKRGKLVRRDTGLRSISIEVASIRAFAGSAT